MRHLTPERAISFAVTYMSLFIFGRGALAWAEIGTWGGAEFTSQRVGKNRRCQRVCLSRRRVCRFARSVGFYPRVERYILYPLYPPSPRCPPLDVDLPKMGCLILTNKILFLLTYSCSRRSMALVSHFAYSQLQASHGTDFIYCVNQLRSFVPTGHVVSSLHKFVDRKIEEPEILWVLSDEWIRSD
jgi:hypothetical protein